MRLSETPRLERKPDYYYDRHLTEFIITPGTFDDFKKSIFAYWQMDQRINPTQKRQKQSNVYVRTERDLRDPNNLFTSIHFFGPKGIVINFEEEYTSQAKKGSRFVDRCVYSGLSYATQIQEYAAHVQETSSSEFNPSVIYIDEFEVIHKGKEITDMMQCLKDIKALSGSAREIPHKIRTALSESR